MTTELDNLRSAWKWGIEGRKFQSIGKAVRSFGWFYEISGLIRDGIEQLELLVQSLLDKQGDNQTDGILGRALAHQALLYLRTGQFGRAQELYKAGISLLRTVNDQELLADALIFSGTLKHLNGDYLEARVLVLEGLEHARASNHPWFIAFGIYSLGMIDSLTGEYQKGYEQMVEGLKAWRELGDPHSISLGLNFLVNTQIELKRYEEAKKAMQESIALSKQSNNRWGMGTAYRFLGLATLAGGQNDEAQGYFKKSLEIFGEYFEGWDIALSLAYLGNAVRMSGNVEEARKIYLKSLRVSLDSQSTPIALEALLGLAHLYAQIDEPERAFELANYVLEHPSSAQDTKDLATELSLKTQKLLSSQQLQKIKEKTLNVSLEDFVKRSSSISSA